MSDNPNNYWKSHQPHFAGASAHHKAMNSPPKVEDLKCFNSYSRPQLKTWEQSGSLARHIILNNAISDHPHDHAPTVSQLLETETAQGKFS